MGAAGARSGGRATGGGTVSICMGSAHKEQLPETQPPRARSCAEAAAAQLIELGRSGPATLRHPRPLCHPSQGAAGACWVPRDELREGGITA